jgi:hypothetical protein
MSLYMRSVEDQPHRQNPDRPARTICGLSLVGAKEVTETQVRVFLGGKICSSCLGIGRARGAAA